MTYLVSILTACFASLVLLVPPAFSESQLMPHKDGTITDTQQMVMWASEDNGVDIGFEDAEKYAKYAFPYAIPTEYDNWRIPYVFELKGLYNEVKRDPKTTAACGKSLRMPPHITLSCNWVWAIRKKTGQHVVFNFAYGSAFGQESGDNSGCRVLPVRDLL